MLFRLFFGMPCAPLDGDRRRGTHPHTLATEAGEEVDDDLTKAEASKKIY